MTTLVHLSKMVADDTLTHKNTSFLTEFLNIPCSYVLYFYHIIGFNRMYTNNVQYKLSIYSKLSKWLANELFSYNERMIG